MILFDLLKQAASRNPGALAIGFHESTISYGDLLIACERFAGGLASLGVRKGSRVALLLPNCPQFAIAYMGAGLAGATVVPVNILCKPDEVRYMLEDSEVEVLIALDAFRPLVNALRPTLKGLKHAVITGESGIEPGEVDFQSLFTQPAQVTEPASEDDTAVIIYTSGTTGRPKGAMLSHSNVIANAKSCEQVLCLNGDDCFLSALPLFHSFAATVFLVLPVLVGAQNHMMDRFTPAHSLTMIEQVRATVFGGVPSMFDLMLEVLLVNRPDLSSLRVCISGGAPLPMELCRRVDEQFGTVMIEGYGLTEASPVVAVNPPFGVRKVGSVGPAIPDVDAKVVDDQGSELETGMIGELVVRGRNVMKGYLHNSTETAHAIENGWLHTGDLARLDEEGYIYIVGRKKELIIVGGMNVYPSEVERVLAEHPAIQEAAAFGVPDATRGEAVWAAVVLAEGSKASDREIQSFCREKLAIYKVPRKIQICSQLPKNALGKVVRHVLRSEVLEAVSAGAVVTSAPRRSAGTGHRVPAGRKR